MKTLSLKTKFLLSYFLSVFLVCSVHAEAGLPLASSSSCNMTVRACDYADFLNHVAVTDSNFFYQEKMRSDSQSASIVRLGTPGNFYYEVIAGRENDPITFVSANNAESYCCWLGSKAETCSMVAGEKISKQNLSSFTFDSSFLANGSSSFDLFLSSSPTLSLAFSSKNPSSLSKDEKFYYSLATALACVAFGTTGMVGENLEEDASRGDVSSESKEIENRTHLLLGDQLSEEELQRFPGAVLYNGEIREVEGPQPGEKTRVKILQTDLQYPYIRVEEVFNSTTGALINRKEMIADHIQIRLKEDEDTSVFLSQLHCADVEPRMEKVTPYAPLYRLHFKPTLEAFAKILEKSKPFAAISEPDCLVYLTMTNNESRCSPNQQDRNQWNFQQPDSSQKHNCYETIPKILRCAFSTPRGGSDIYRAWDLQHDASNIVAAVIDSGIRSSHEKFVKPMWKNNKLRSNYEEGEFEHGYSSYKNNTEYEYGDTVDHGTRCAGIIGAEYTGVGEFSGIAYKVQLMDCKIDMRRNQVDQLMLPVISTKSQVAASVIYAIRNGAHILNCSFESNVGLENEYLAFKEAQEKGVIVVVAAGNSGVNLDSQSRAVLSYPSSYAYTHGNFLGLNNIVTVAATDRHDRLASFSNYGPGSVDIAAPGVDILSTTAVADRYDSLVGINPYAVASGTSMAAPHATGALALMKAYAPSLSYEELINSLYEGADKLRKLNGKIIGGRRLNVRNALEKVAALTNKAGVREKLGQITSLNSETKDDDVL